MADTQFDPETGEILSNKPNLAELSVSELASALKRTLEDRFGHVRVRGEISGFRGPHSSGHCYFSIKDEGAKLDAVIWRGSFGRLRAKLKEGLEVIATGKITSYPQKSGYQIIVEAVEPAGIGALMALLEERKKLLAAEGLFDAARKKPIPFLPAVIGVVTSPTGAVIRDILHRLNDRFPRRVVVWPVRVQGETSAAEVAAAIAGFNALTPDGRVPRPDVIIVARGGGSLEDLWSFNEEIVVRAVAASAIPLISAVGHETDTTLIDFVSDMRCPTPTAAAECAVPVRGELLANLATLSGRHLRAMSRALTDRQTRLRAAGRALPRPDDVLALARQRLDAAGGRLTQALRANSHAHRLGLERLKGRISAGPLLRRLEDQRHRLEGQALRAPRAIGRLLDASRTALNAQTRLYDSLSYKAVLKRGYAIVRDKSDRLVAAAANTKPGQQVSVEFHDGKRGARIETDPKMPPRQGSLF